MERFRYRQNTRVRSASLFPGPRGPGSRTSLRSPSGGWLEEVKKSRRLICIYFGPRLGAGRAPLVGSLPAPPLPQRSRLRGRGWSLQDLVDRWAGQGDCSGNRSFGCPLASHPIHDLDLLIGHLSRRPFFAPESGSVLPRDCGPSTDIEPRKV